MKRLASSLVLTLVAMFMASGVASADVLIDAGVGSNPQFFNFGDYVAGSEFTTTSTILVNALGYLDAEGDGLVDSHKVGLWDASNGALLATATVTNGSSTEATAFAGAQWFLEAFDGGGTLSLAPGTYRVAGRVGRIGDAIALSNDKVGNGVTISSGYVRTSFPNGGFNYPSFTFGSNAIRATVGFTTTTTVPEPASLALLGLAGVAVGFVRRRRR